MGLFNVYVNDKPENTPTKKKKAGVMNVALIILLVITLAFTGAMIYLFMQYQAVPDTLITCFFAVAGGECGILGWIKTTKERKQKREWQIEDEERDDKYGSY